MAVKIEKHKKKTAGVGGPALSVTQISQLAVHV